MVDGGRQLIKFKRGTFETLSSINPIIDSGQPCVATNYNGGGAKLVIGDGSTVFNDLPYVTLQDEDVLTVPNVVPLGSVPTTSEAGVEWTRDLTSLGDVSVENLSIGNRSVADFIFEEGLAPANDDMWYYRRYKGGCIDLLLLNTPTYNGSTPTTFAGGYYSTCTISLPRATISPSATLHLMGHARMGTGFGYIAYWNRSMNDLTLGVWSNQNSRQITISSLYIYTNSRTY